MNVVKRFVNCLQKLKKKLLAIRITKPVFSHFTTITNTTFLFLKRSGISGWLGHRHNRWGNSVATPIIGCGPVIPQTLACFVFTAGKMGNQLLTHRIMFLTNCLLYTSDAADEEDSVDLGGR